MFKELLKKVVGLHRWNFMIWSRYHFGFWSGIKALVQLLMNKNLVKVPVPGNTAYVWLRPGTMDLTVYENTFLDKHYNYDWTYLGENNIITNIRSKN